MGEGSSLVICWGKGEESCGGRSYEGRGGLTAEHFQRIVRILLTMKDSPAQDGVTSEPNAHPHRTFSLILIGVSLLASSPVPSRYETLSHFQRCRSLVLPSHQVMTLPSFPLSELGAPILMPPAHPLTWSSGSRENRQRRSCALGREPGVPMGHQILLLRDRDQKRPIPKEVCPAPPPGLSYPARPTSQGKALGTRAFFTRLPQGGSDTTPQTAASRLFIAGSGQQLLQAARGQTPVPRAGLNVHGLPASIAVAIVPQSQEPRKERQDGFMGGGGGLAVTTWTSCLRGLSYPS